MGGQEPSVTDRGAVVVAGGAGALGSAIAKELLRRGRNVLVVDMVAPQDPAMPHVIADVTDRDAVQEELCARLGAMPAPEALIYAAGFIRHAGFLDLTPEDVTGHINVNLIGAVNVSQVVARQMLEAGGKILLLSSVHGSIGMPGRAAYSISKAGIGAMARVMAVELAVHNIQVNVLAPGPVDSGMGGDMSARALWCRDTPAQRVVRAEEVARFAASLVSDDAAFLTGQTITLDGGATALRPYQSDFL